MSKKHSSSRRSAGWDPVADWYDGWVGKDGSDHHRNIAIPTVLDLLDLQSDEQVLDVGSGQGVLASYIVKAGAHYTGVDISPRLVKLARQHHPENDHLADKPRLKFLVGDARKLKTIRGLSPESFDAAVFLLSIQDMNPLETVIQAASWAIKNRGRIVILMTHPCFRIPRQSGWGYDEGRKLQYRRVDHYLTPLAVPLKSYGRRGGKTTSFHRPLSAYFSVLAANQFVVDDLREVTTFKQQRDKAARRADQQIPLFLALRAWKGLM